MPKTKTFPVTDAIDVAVIAVTTTPCIKIQEDPGIVGWPTQNFMIKKPTSSDTGIQRPIGGEYKFERQSCFNPGETVGWVRLVNASTSTTFQQDES